MTTSTTTSSPNDAPGSNASTKAPEPQVNRACEACRFHKVRCLPEPSVPGRCQRCVKTNRECIFAAPQRRRPRRRAEARMAELEKEVRAMRSLLKDNGGPHSEDDAGRRRESTGARTGDEDSDDGGMVEGPDYAGKDNSGIEVTAETLTTGGRVSSGDPTTLPGIPLPGSTGDSTLSPDVIDRGVVTMQLASELVMAYSNSLVEHCPTVILPKGTTASGLRRSQPVLFLAVIAVASLRLESELANSLRNELYRAFAEILFIRCEKSRELIQAFVVTVTFGNPPDQVRNLQVFQHAHLAASMAMDIGLGYRPTGYQAAAKDGQLDKFLREESQIQDCRTMLACWLSTARVATKTRRPSLLPFTNWMNECVSIFEKSASVHDRRLVAWIKLQRVANEAATSFGFDDASTSIELTALRMQVIIKAFERRMDEWREEFAPLINVALWLEFYCNYTTVYEFAMDGGKHEGDFRKKHFNLPVIGDDSADVKPHMPLSPLEVDATVKCITSAHNTLDTFLRLNTQALREAPNIFFVMTTYNLVVLLRLNVAFSLGSNELAELLDTQSVKFDYYMEAVYRKYGDAIGPQLCRVPLHWHEILGKIRGWYENNKAKLAKGEANKQQPPHLTPREQQQQQQQQSPGMSSDSTLSQPGGVPGDPMQFQPANPFTPSNTASPDNVGGLFMNPTNPMPNWLDSMDLGGAENFVINDFPMSMNTWGTESQFFGGTGGMFQN